MIVANGDVSRVELKRDKFGVAIAKIETNRRQKIDVNLIGLTPPQASQVKQVFPNAQIIAPQDTFAMPTPPVYRPQPPKTVPVRPTAPAGASPAPAPAWSTKTVISDPDIHSLEDLTRLFPLPDGFAYQQNDNGMFVIVRTSDGAQFTFLVEEDMLGFDVPTPEGPRRKKTFEIFKQ